MNGPHDLCMAIADLSAGGAQRVFSQLANHWAAQGLKIAVVTLSEERDDFFRLDPRVDRQSIGGLKPSSGAFNALVANLRRLLALRRAIAVADAPCVLSFVGAMNVMCIAASAGLGRRVIISERNDPSRQSLGRFWDRMRRWLYPRADLVTANSEAALRALAAFVPARKLAYVPNPIARAEGSELAALPPQTVLNVGRLTAQKAQDVLLDAFAQATSEMTGSEWHLAFIGSGECEAALRQQADALGIAERVLFIGQVGDPFPYCRAAGIFALPSRFEGTPNALLEAMSCGLPPIVSDASGGPLDYVTDGESGLVVAANDAPSLARALARLMSDSALRTRLGNAARDRLRNHSFESALETWQAVLGLPVPMQRP